MTEERMFTVTGMGCAGCVAYVQKALNGLVGVKSADVSLQEGRALVRYDSEVVTPEEMKAAVDALGYKLLIGDDQKQAEGLQEAQKRGLRALRVRLIVAAILAVFMMVLHHMEAPFGMSETAKQWVLAIAAGVVYFYCAWGHHKRCFLQLRHGAFTMDTLISLSISVAFWFSLVRLFILHTAASDLFRSSYFDVVGMIMTFVLLGKLLEENAKYRTNDALRKLMALAPDEALVERDGQTLTLPSAAIMIGDIVVLRHGDRVPVDGVLTEVGSFDESSITGEPLPVDKEAGNKVFSGTISVGQATRMRAEVVGNDTLLERIISTVRNAQASKAPLQRIADKISGIFVPIILTLALLTFLFWGLSGDSDPWLHGIYFAISVLVIACPCALGLATPTAITVAMGKASEQGLLIRDAIALEQLSRVTDVIYDKTGTLTTGVPAVVAEEWTGDKEELIPLIVKAEMHSTHPVAQALAKHFTGYLQDAQSIDLIDLREEPGKGLSFVHNGKAYRLGAFDPTEKSDQDRFTPIKMIDQHHDANIIELVEDGQTVGMIAIEDELLPEAKEAIGRLQSKGNVRVHMLSGDRSARTERIAQELGIEQAHGGLSPIDKKSYIEQLQKERRIVAMIGDGINDSPALAQADLSIALGTGSDIATDVAMVTSIGSSPFAVEKAINLSKHTVRTIYTNFFWAFIYNMIAVPVAAGLFYPTLTISPMWAAGAMAASSLCVVLNSLRLKTVKMN